MPFKYAAFTVMMPELTIEEAAASLKELGYDGIEWRVHSVPADSPTKADYWRGNKATVDVDSIKEKARDIRILSERNDLEILGLGTYLSYKHLDDVRRCMEAAAIMSAGCVRVAPPSYDGSVNYNDLFEEAIAGFSAIEELAREYGVCAAVEVRPGSICGSACLAYRFVEHFDPDHIGVILDPGNTLSEGHENWQLILDLLGPYLSHVHVKNVAWRAEDTSEGGKRWTTVPAPIAQGAVSWSDVLSALDRVGFSGWLSVEDFAPGDSKAKLADDIRFLKGLEC